MKYIKSPRINRDLSILGLGCGHLHKNGVELGVELVKKAIEAGVNYFDVAPTYPDAQENYGLNEKILGEGIRGKEDEVFVATKVLMRSFAETAQEIAESLERLGKIDLIQLHAVDTKETKDLVFSDEGALAAITQAKKRGLVKYIGITNHHNPFILKECLERFDFDAVMMPLGVIDVIKNKFRHLADSVLQNGKLVVGMKILGHGMLGPVAASALKFGLKQSISVMIVGVASEQELIQNLKAVEEPIFLENEEKNLIEFATGALAGKNPWWLENPSGAFPFGQYLKEK